VPLEDAPDDVAQVVQHMEAVSDLLGCRRTRAMVVGLRPSSAAICRMLLPRLARR
jgi:hypothetical protein